MNVRSFKSFSYKGQFGSRSEKERRGRDSSERSDAGESFESATMSAVIHFLLSLERHREFVTRFVDSTDGLRVSVVDLIHSMIEVTSSDKLEKNRDRNL